MVLYFCELGRKCWDDVTNGIVYDHFYVTRFLTRGFVYENESSFAKLSIFHGTL